MLILGSAMKKTLVSALITFYVWLVFIVTLLPLFLIYLLVWIITLPFDRKRIFCHRYVSVWAGFYIHINPWWKVTIENRFRMVPGQAYIILSNHQSVLDVLAYYQLRFPFQWIVKQELFQIPVLGWLLYLNGDIPVIRGDKQSAERMTVRAVQSLRNGTSILIFPEGTRTKDGTIGAFKEGAFRIALEAKVPLLPVVIDGAFDALPKEEFLFRGKKHIAIRILEAIKPEDYDSLPLPMLLNKTEKLMADEHKRLRNENILLHHE
jgi:1-acyl-sn-glycerol-3-phosphate acyltransferase